MPWYNDLRPQEDKHKQEYGLIFPYMSDEEKIRTIENLLKLRESLNEIPNKRTDKNLLICSWNLKDFGGYKHREPESYFYLAEIIAKFDIISIQECRTNLEPLKILFKILGSHWAYLFNDVSDHEGSNSERSLIIYDTRRCKFSGQAGEIILHHKISQNNTLKQFNRIPYLTGFTAEWKKFSLITLHLEPGNSSNSREIRTSEIKFLMELLKKRLRKNSQVRLWSDNVIIVGDMNLYKNNKEAFELFEKNFFEEVEKLKDKDTTTAKSDNIFDHIFYYGKSKFTALEKSNKAGVFNMFDTIYTDDQHNDPAYLEIINNLEKDRITKGDKPFTDKESYYKIHWRTRQISDHYPIWIEMNIDSSEDFLKMKLGQFES